MTKGINGKDVFDKGVNTGSGGLSPLGSAQSHLFSMMAKSAKKDREQLISELTKSANSYEVVLQALQYAEMHRKI